MNKEQNRPKRDLVIPGELLSEGELKAGKNTYRKKNKVYASQLGFKSVTSNYVNVIPLSGRYIPKPDDLIIGVVNSVSPTTWLIDINSPYPAPLHVNEVPWRVDFGDTARYLITGDTILCRIFIVDEVKKVQVTMKDQGSRKLSGGQVIEISPSKVPRVIGKGGSMISLIKQKTMCRLFVGQNGRIWIDGEPEKIRVAVDAIRFIERESHRFGLTETVEGYLNEALSPEGKVKPGETRRDVEKPKTDHKDTTGGFEKPQVERKEPQGDIDVARGTPSSVVTPAAEARDGSFAPPAERTSPAPTRTPGNTPVRTDTRRSGPQRPSDGRPRPITPAAQPKPADIESKSPSPAPEFSRPQPGPSLTMQTKREPVASPVIPVAKPETRVNAQPAVSPPVRPSSPPTAPPMMSLDRTTAPRPEEKAEPLSKQGATAPTGLDRFASGIPHEQKENVDKEKILKNEVFERVDD